MFFIWRERLVPSGRTDGVKSRCTAGAKITAKGRRRNLEKPSRSPEKSVTHMVQNRALLGHVTTPRHVSILSFPFATGNNDNRFGLRTLFIHSAPSRTTLPGCFKVIYGQKDGSLKHARPPPCALPSPLSKEVRRRSHHPCHIQSLCMSPPPKKNANKLP